jgi:hypothetical protein
MLAKPAKRRRCTKKQPKPFELTPRQQATVQNWELAYGLAPKLTAVVDDCGLSQVYERLARGEYDGYKDGASTKVTVASIKRRRQSLPRAEYKPAF